MNAQFWTLFGLSLAFLGLVLWLVKIALDRFEDWRARPSKVLLSLIVGGKGRR